jgi:RimJ/RimL family protein N-acetyltransferase
MRFTEIEPELGWTIHRNYWRQGFGTEIASLRCSGTNFH